jgi:hypothetical protein
MHLRFLGKDSTPDNSPTLYATDEASYVVQGWVVTDDLVLSQIEVPDNETIVEVPPGLFAFLAADGLNGAPVELQAPIVAVNGVGNYIVQGERVTDPAVLSQMSIPDHETCVLVARTAMAALVGG